MKNTEQTIGCAETIREKYADEMIRLALLYAEEMRMQEIIAQAETTPEQTDELHRQRIFVQAWKKAEAEHAEQRRQRQRAKIRRIARRIVTTAAALVLAAGISLGIALATSDVAREYAQRLLFTLDNAQHQLTVQYKRYDVDTLNIPEEWNGNFYPAYIPEGFEVVECYAFQDVVYMVRLRNGKGGSIMFYEEYSKELSDDVNINDNTIEYVDINGRTGLMNYDADEPFVALYWQTDICYMEIWSEGITAEQAIEIAESMVYIK